MMLKTGIKHHCTRLSKVCGDFQNFNFCPFFGDQIPKKAKFTKISKNDHCLDFASPIIVKKQISNIAAYSLGRHLYAIYQSIVLHITEVLFGQAQPDFWLRKTVVMDFFLNI